MRPCVGEVREMPVPFLPVSSSPLPLWVFRVKRVGALSTLTFRPTNPYTKVANFLNVLPVERLENRIVEPQTRSMNLI